MAPSTPQLDIMATYGTAWRAEEVEAFKSAISAVVARVEESLRARHPWIRLRPRYLTFAEASGLEEATTNCAVAILDATDCDGELALLLGRLQGGHVPHVVSWRLGSEPALGQLGLRGSQVVYNSMEDFARANSLLEQELSRAVPEVRIHDELIYQLWFPRETSTIWVVCPQIHEPGEFADRSSPDYTYLDNLGDTDALLDVMVFLSRYYPKAMIQRFSSSDLPSGHTSSNLVVIGGPGSAEISNDICSDMMRAISSRVSYSSDCEQMIVTVKPGTVNEYRAEHRANQVSGQRGERELRKDHGYFARFANPLNEKAGVVLINGIHTAGVLGAARAFSDRREALRNFNNVFAASSFLTEFECHFEVVVLNGTVNVPSVESGDILRLARSSYADTKPVHPKDAGDHRPESVKILFIAGDRGGGQLNQLQIPNEFSAIRDALRSSRYRDFIALATPILGATREELAQAYREEPCVVHFTGHGSERSLSILEDRTVIAKAIPLDALQLSEMFNTIKPRVGLCVLNACTSAELARYLAATGAVCCAIGWPAKIPDSVAIAFSRALYDSLGDGRSVAEALKVAKVASAPYVPEHFVAAELKDIVFITSEVEKQ